MRFLNIASGSSGNATYIGTEDTHILIDAGISRKRINEGLAKADVTLNDLDAILITHEHIDHISALGVLERTRPVPIYATRGTIEGILSCPMLGDYPKDLFIEI
ncbi:MAG: MBL fold metallo-hydrolase, partial [Lachnospiraceae bacterium]|nr:MBL fold metallo-hydrolase [Lachnospiraceae bacterium]